MDIYMDIMLTHLLTQLITYILCLCIIFSVCRCYTSFSRLFMSLSQMNSQSH